MILACIGVGLYSYIQQKKKKKKKIALDHDDVSGLQSRRNFNNV